MRETTFFIMLVIAIATLVVILVALYFRHRNLQMFHQERMAALEKGTAIPIGHALAPWSPRVYLLRGLLWSFAGATLIISLLGIAASTHRPEPAETALWRSQNLVRSLNISIDEAKKIVEQDQGSRQQGMPWTFALLGLIPLGVGLAYLVFYHTGESQRLEEARPQT